MTHATQSPRAIIIGGTAPANAVPVEQATPDSPAVYAERPDTVEEYTEQVPYLADYEERVPIPGAEPDPITGIVPTEPIKRQEWRTRAEMRTRIIPGTREEERLCAAWLATLPRPEPIPAPEPVPATVSNQQLRLALIDAGIMPSAILAQLQAMPSGAAKEKALAAWEYANEFRRDHPLVTALSAQLGLTSAQVDSLFRSAATLG